MAARALAKCAQHVHGKGIDHALSRFYTSSWFSLSRNTRTILLSVTPHRLWILKGLIERERGTVGRKIPCFKRSFEDHTTRNIPLSKTAVYLHDRAALCFERRYPVMETPPPDPLQTHSYIFYPFAVVELGHQPTLS